MSVELTLSSNSSRLRPLVPFVLGTLRRQPLQALVGLFGVALGVAVVVAIDLAADSARLANRTALESEAGAATHRIVGGPRGVPEDVFATLRVGASERSATPSVSGRVQVTSDSGMSERVDLVGVDPFIHFTHQTLGRTLRGDGAIAAATMLTRDVTWLGARTAARLDVSTGDRLQVKGSGAAFTVEVAGILESDDSAVQPWLDSRFYVDIALAQEILGKVGHLDSIEMVEPRVRDDDWLRQIQSLLPEGVEMETVDQRFQHAERLMRSFDTNLDMLGLLALMVGLLLIYNAMTFTHVLRRPSLGVLRAMGVTRRQLFAMTLGESLVVGLVASVCGVLLGIGLADELLVHVSRTLNDLYFQVEVTQLALRPPTLITALVLGTLGAVIAGIGPAWEASTVTAATATKRSTLEQRVSGWLPALAGLGLAMLGLSIVLITTADFGLNGVFSALAVGVLGFAAMTPWLLFHALVLAARCALSSRQSTAGVALFGLRSSLSRCAVAVAALTVALGTMLGVSVMIDSFRTNVDSWIKNTLRADFYLFEPGARSASNIPVSLRDYLLSLPDVQTLSMGRGAQVAGRSGPVDVTALHLPPPSHHGFEFLTRGSTEPDIVWRDYEHGAVLVSEPFSRKHKVGVEDSVELRSAKGWRSYPIAGVYRDYGSEQGTVIMPMHVYARDFNDRQVSTLGVYLVDGATEDEVVKALESHLQGTFAFETRSAKAIHTASLVVFDRTFAVTQVLKLITLTVAFTGVLAALLALQLERRREIALLRSCGFTRWQAAFSVYVQTGAIGLASGVFAIPLGWAVGVVLVHVVNVRAFGWSMTMEFGYGLFVETVAMAVLAALIAGTYPAFKLARTNAAQGLRFE